MGQQGGPEHGEAFLFLAHDDVHAGHLLRKRDDNVDVGVSLHGRRADAEVAMGVGNDAQIYGPPVGMTDGQLRFDGDSWAPGANIGLMYRPASATRLCLTWTSRTNHDLDRDVDAADLHPVLASMLSFVGTPRLKMSFP